VAVRPWIALMLTLFVGGAAAVAAASTDAAGVRIFSGEARHPRSGELLYTERHERRVEPDGSVTVESEYRDPTGTIFATRSVRLAATGFLPAYGFHDSRSGLEEGIRLDDTSAVMYRRRGAGRPIEERTLTDGGLLVADAGFERLILRRWDQLVADQKVEAVLVVPSRLRAFRFEITKVDEGAIGGVPAITFRMSFANPLLRLLAPKLLISYHRENRTLVAFDGASNLEKPGGGHYTVTVRYRDEPAGELSE
jgi:hypothetical protein